MSKGRRAGRGERTRVALCFALLGFVPVFLFGWLGWVQVLGQGRLMREDRPPLRLGVGTVERQQFRSEDLPAPRGTIVDRHDRLLAVDCESYEVRLEVNARFPSLRRREELKAFLVRMADEVATILARAPEVEEDAGYRSRQRRTLRSRLFRAFHFAGDPVGDPPAHADVLVAVDVASLRVIEGLRDLDRRQDPVHVHWLRGFQRMYPERDYTYGVVGFVEHLPDPTSELPGYRRFGVWGMERLRILDAGQPGLRRLLRDSRFRGYWAAPAREPAPANVLRTTLDLELQKAAVRELARAAEADNEAGKKPKWGALVLLEIETGDVLAMASWHRDVEHDKGTRVTPYQSVYEPGSVVKPLVLGFARERAGLDWTRTFDCAPTRPRRGWDNGYGRIIHDDHECGSLTPHGILVNSSNIGAVKVGMTLSREQWREYLAFYQFGKSVDLELPGELIGGHGGDLRASDRHFWRFTAPSLSIGYEVNVNTLQLARAYLTLLSGAQRRLRLYRAVAYDGTEVELPPAPPGPRELAPATVQGVIAAMVDVVGPDPATGRHLRDLLMTERGRDVHGLIAGKTGTAASKVGIGDGRIMEVRNASFVGFAPAGRPRYLAVCVLQRDGTARFYGGSYAAAPVGRLLLHALREDEARPLRWKPQVGATPGGSGWGGRPQRARQGGND